MIELNGRFAVAIFALLLTSCAEPTIDASSVDRFNASVNRMANRLPPEDALGFRLGVSLLMSEEGKSYRELMENGDLIKFRKEIANGRHYLDGMTYPEIEAELEKMRAGQRKRDYQKSSADLARAKKLKAGEGEVAPQRRDSLLITTADLNALRPKAAAGKNGLFVYLEFQNQLSVPVSRLDVSLTLRNASGTIRKVGSMKFRGTVAPGTFKAWKQGFPELTPWRKLKYQRDDRLEAVISAAYGADKDLLYRVFTPADSLLIERLEQ